MIIWTTLTALFLLAPVQATLTVYTATPTTTATAALLSYTPASADQTYLQAPSPPEGQAASVAIQLYDGGMTGMGLPVSGNFLGFSIELSVAAMLMGENAQVLRPEFLNYCAILESRGGAVTIRVGGNTQDRAILNVDGNPNNRTIQKYQSVGEAPTDTPDVHFTLDVFQVMAEITKLLNVKWFFGIPFIATDSDGNAGLVMTNAQNILGDNLIGLQLANEPDLYGPHLKKDASYSIDNFMADTTTMIQRLPVTEPILIGPSICCMWDVNAVESIYLGNFSSTIKLIDAMHYPDNNCATEKPDPQTKFANYLSHTQVQDITSPYFSSAAMAIAAGKQYMMMETNTASCGGFAGVSDSFASSLWGIDYGLQMAYGNFTYALFHFGGQNVYYNPFTPPPTNLTAYRQWSTGAIFYSNIVVAEALGKSGNARVIDLYMDNNNANRAGYAVYEQGAASRVVLINYVSDPTGASTYTAVISIGGGSTGLASTTPASVRVKYLLADSVSQKYNITWAGQTMGDQFKSDGRLYGTANVTTIACDTTAGTCSIPLPAPCAAVVFLTDAAYQNSGGDAAETAPLTFATTTTTGKKANQVVFDWAAISTSNGRSAKDPKGATSKGGAVPSAATGRPSISGWRWIIDMVVALGVGALMV